MPINVFGNSNSHDGGNKTDTSLIVHKPYLRTNYLESNNEEVFDFKNKFRNKKLPGPISIREPASKSYVDNIFKNDIDFNDVKLENIKFVKINYQPAINQHLTPEIYVDNAIDEQSLVRKKQDNDFNNNNLTNINSITLNTQAVNDNEVITKVYVDQTRNDNERNSRDVGLSFHNEEVDLVKNNQDYDLNDNKLTNLDSITINRNPTSDKKVSNKKNINDQLDKNTIVRFNQTLQNYLEVSVGSDTYNTTKFNKIQLTDITKMKAGSSGGYILPYWKIICNDKNNSGKIQNFI